MAIRSKLNPLSITINISNVEQIFVMETIFPRKFIFGAVYFPPNSHFQSYESHVSIVENVISIKSPYSFILYGVFNFPNTNWASDNLGFIARGN
jgi:hypothetical protein